MVTLTDVVGLINLRGPPIQRAKRYVVFLRDGNPNYSLRNNVVSSATMAYRDDCDCDSGSNCDCSQDGDCDCTSNNCDDC